MQFDSLEAAAEFLKTVNAKAYNFTLGFNFKENKFEVWSFPK